MVRLHYLAPTKQNTHVIIFYRNFMKYKPNFCHIGLGVNALHTVKVLRANKFRADCYGVWLYDEIIKILQRPENADCTHAVIEAPWVSGQQFNEMMIKFPHINFICRNHSQIGFLQVEAGAVRMIREYLLLQDGNFNFQFAANNIRFCQYCEQAYHGRCIYLPNLYNYDRPARKQIVGPFDHKLLRIGSFGSIRLLKNHSTAAAAAQMIARSRNCDLEFHMSVNREEQGQGVLQMIRFMFQNLPWAKLIEIPWQQWAEFRQTIANMDLCMQVSFTETFNIATADAVAENVPAVVSSAIEWCPPDWKADIDDANDICRKGNYLLSNPWAVTIGLDHLKAFIRKGIATWTRFLTDKPVSNNPLDY